VLNDVDKLELQLRRSRMTRSWGRCGRRRGEGATGV